MMFGHTYHLLVLVFINNCDLIQGQRRCDCDNSQEDQNDEFKSAEFVQTDFISETSKAKTFGRIDINDEDASRNHICSISKILEGSAVATIELRNGINVVKLLEHQLDFETQSTFRFSFVCIDIGRRNFSRNGKASVTVIDSNERPRSPCLKTTYIPLTNETGLPVIMLKSKDPDNILYDDGVTGKPKQRLFYTLDPGNDYFEIRDENILTLRKKLVLNVTYIYKIQVTDDGRLAVRRKDNKLTYYNGVPQKRIYTCKLMALEPTDDRLLIIKLSSSSISDRPKKGNIVGEFIVNKNIPYSYDIYRQDKSILGIIGKELLVMNDTVLDIKQKDSYSVIVSATEKTTGDVVYQLFKLSVTGGKYCIDVDGSATNTCDQMCHDIDGGYECRCRDGYYLLADGQTCKPYNCSKLHLSECPTDSYTDHFGSVCKNASYTCSKYREFESRCDFQCPDGYGLAKIQRIVNKQFGEDMASADFDGISSSVFCAYNNGIKWSLLANETSAYFCRRLHDPPRSLSLSNKVIKEHSIEGTIIGIIFASHYSPIVFTLNANNNHNFMINNTVLHANKVFSLKNLKNAVRLVTIRATDQLNATLYIDTTFNITVLNVNDPPKHITITNNVFTEFTPVNHVIGELSAIDYDSIDPIRTSDFDWKLLSNPEGMFKLNGSLLVLQKLVLLKKDFIYKIVVQCTDRHVMPKSATREIYLQSKNVNTHPENLQLRVGEKDYTLYENTTVNSVVGKIMATDKNKDIISYEIISDFKETFSFGPVNCSHLDNNTTHCFADIVLRKKLDYERKDEYEIEIKAADSTGEFTLKDFKIKIADVNENPSDVTITLNTINENSPIDTLAGTLTVADEDENDTHHCQILDVDAPFKLIGFNLLVKDDILDYEKKPEYNVTVRCDDSGFPALSLTKVLSIFLQDQNDEFKSAEFVQTHYISEISKAKTFGRIDINDEDASRNHICSISQILEGPAVATVELRNGINVVKLLEHRFDFETQSTFRFSFVCTDIGRRNFSRKGEASVTVIDSNERPRSPCLKTTYIPFTNETGLPVIMLKSKDPDNILYDDGFATKPKQRLFYTLISGDDYFEIRDESILTLRKKLVLNVTYIYKIQVTDDGRLALQEKDNKLTYYNGVPQTQIYTCKLMALEPTDDRLLIIKLSSSSISDRPKKGNIVAEFIVNKNISYSYDIYRQDKGILGIIGKELLVMNDTVLDIKQKVSYSVIVSATEKTTGDVVYQLFKLIVTVACSEFEYYDAQARKCKCKEGRVGVKCDRDAALCASPQCANDEVCSILIANPIRCVPKGNVLPILLQLSRTFYKTGIVQYDVEDNIKYILEKPINSSSRRKRNMRDEIYVEGSKPIAVGNSYTYVKFIPTDENSNYRLLDGKTLCSRLTNTQYRCVNKEDCKILKSFGISCPYPFVELQTTPPVVAGVDDATPDWMWFPIGATLLIFVIVIVIIFVRRHRRSIKEDVRMKRNVVKHDFPINNPNYMEIERRAADQPNQKVDQTSDYAIVENANIESHENTKRTMEVKSQSDVVSNIDA